MEQKNNNHWGFRSVWGVLQVIWHEWHEFLTGFSAYFFLQVCDQQHGLWTIRGGATISLVSMGDAGLLRRMVPFRASARRRHRFPVLKDGFGVRFGCWKMLKDDERWYPLVNVYVTNWKDPPCYENGDSSTINRLGHGFNSKLLVCQRVSHGSPDISRYLQEQGASLTES